MNQTIKVVLFVLAGLLIAAALIFAGFFFGQRQNPQVEYGYGYNADNGFNMPFFNRGFGGMMGGFRGSRGNGNFGTGFGMMGGNGMLGGFGYSASPSNAATLTVESARNTVQDYLDTLGNADLEIEEVMLFNQNAYAIVVEKSTGLGAMELLVDPDTLNVFPEYGPNRMWNLKYGMMGNRAGGCNFGGGGTCGGNFAQSDLNATADMAVSMDDAADLANEYLAANINGASVHLPGTAFYGYYTFDYKEDGQMTGMLSVNGSTGQVWLHTWHGQFIEEWELEEAE
jgi:hypothetical protein